MKKLLLSITLAALCAQAGAQQYIIVDDGLPIPASNVEKITYEQEEQFSSCLLPAVLAADTKAQLFSSALLETGIAKTLNNYQYNDYQAPSDYYTIGSGDYLGSPIKYWYNTNRNKMFTMFVETDNVLAEQGINSIDDLKAYAKQVYDAVYPEDANVSDPKDPRNSLNRFVAYHILPFGCTYWYLTSYDGKETDKCIDTDMTDIAAWYGTLMSNASLKCSYPMGTQSGVYVNRRGLKDNPDIRGAKVVSDSSNSSDPFTHQAFNGYYYYIDRILTYDKATQDDVLGSELWRVDFKALSPDIMNNSEDLRGNWRNVNSQDVKDGRNLAYDWNCLENITAENMNGVFLARRAGYYYSVYLCDEVNVLGNGGSITIKLPPLPPGEWEIRMGTTAQDTRPKLKVYLNGQLTIESLDLTLRNYSADMDFSNNPLRNEILDYMSKNVFKVTQQDIGQFLVTDAKTGEQILLASDPYEYYENVVGGGINRGYRGFLAIENPIRSFIGTDPSTGADLDWNSRANNYRKQAVNDYCDSVKLPKCMKAPEECKCNNGGSGNWVSISEYDISVRYPLGRITTDGKTDNYLKLEYIPDGKSGNNYELALDYFEFVPKPIYDNE